MPDRIAEIRARLDAATPGPWRDDHQSWCIWAPDHEADEPDARCLVAEVGCGPDTDLIAHAPADIAWLLEEVIRLREIEQHDDHWRRQFYALRNRVRKAGISI